MTNREMYYLSKTFSMTSIPRAVSVSITLSHIAVIEL